MPTEQNGVEQTAVENADKQATNLSQKIFSGYCIVVLILIAFLNPINALLFSLCNIYIPWFFIWFIIYPILILLIDKSYCDKPVALISKMLLLPPLLGLNLFLCFLLARFFVIPLNGGESSILLMLYYAVVVSPAALGSAYIITRVFTIVGGRPPHRKKLFYAASACFIVAVVVFPRFARFNEGYKLAANAFPRKISRVTNAAIQKKDILKCEDIRGLFRKSRYYLGVSDTWEGNPRETAFSPLNRLNSYESFAYYSCIYATEAVTAHNYNECTVPLGLSELKYKSQTVGEHGRLLIHKECRKYYLESYPQENIEEVSMDVMCENMLQQFDDAVSINGAIIGTDNQQYVAGTLVGAICVEKTAERCEQQYLLFFGKNKLGSVLTDINDNEEENLGRLCAIDIQAANTLREYDRYYVHYRPAFQFYADKDESEQEACPTIDWNERQKQIEQLVRKFR